jgi:hypothetical protein
MFFTPPAMGLGVELAQRGCRWLTTAMSVRGSKADVNRAPRRVNH